MSQTETTGADSGNTDAPKGIVPEEVSDERHLSASSSDETAERTGSSPLPRVWSRYIDSRLKQFCTR